MELYSCDVKLHPFGLLNCGNRWVRCLYDIIGISSIIHLSTWFMLSSFGICVCGFLISHVLCVCGHLNL